MTHTLATLEVSQSTVKEISAKLCEAGYDHCLHIDSKGRISIDMTGLMLKERPL